LFAIIRKRSGTAFENASSKKIKKRGTISSVWIVQVVATALLLHALMITMIPALQNAACPKCVMAETGWTSRRGPLVQFTEDRERAVKHLIFFGCCLSAGISCLIFFSLLGSGFFKVPGIEVNLGVIAQTGLGMFALSITAALRQWKLKSADLVILPIMLAAILSFAFTAMATHNAVVSSWIGALHIGLAMVGMWWLHRRNVYKTPGQFDAA